MSHIQEMGRRKATQNEAFAVPDIDIETLLRDRGKEDLLMDPRVLEAIARMQPDRAAQVLRLIEDKRAGLDPLQDIPSLSLDAKDPVPESLALKGWILKRDASGAPYMQLGSDVASRILIVPSMILGDLGRVTSVQDDPGGFRVTLETGDTLEGEVTTAQHVIGDPSSELTADPDFGGEQVMPAGGAGRDIIRPRARPEGLRIIPDPSESNGLDVLLVEEVVRAAATIRPKQRPADMGGETDTAPVETE